MTAIKTKWIADASITADKVADNSISYDELSVLAFDPTQFEMGVSSYDLVAGALTGATGVYGVGPTGPTGANGTLAVGPTAGTVAVATGIDEYGLEYSGAWGTIDSRAIAHDALSISHIPVSAFSSNGALGLVSSKVSIVDGGLTIDKLKLTGVLTCPDQATAESWGLAQGTLYRTATGVLRIVL